MRMLFTGRTVVGQAAALVLVLPFLLFLADAGKHERRLINDLFMHYNKFERPVSNESEPVTLYFGIRYHLPPYRVQGLTKICSFQQIVDLDEKNQILTSNIWLNLDWVDQALTWNSSEYGGITVSTLLFISLQI